MEDENWYLKQYADFIYLLDCDAQEENHRDKLQKRLKKDREAWEILLDVLSKIDERGFDEGLQFALCTNRAERIRNTSLDLLEIKAKGTLWRVVTLRCKQQKALVMLDAFKNHEVVSVTEMVKRVTPLVEIAEALLKEND